MSMRHRLQAAIGLLHRYHAVFFHFWTRRHAMRTDFFNKQEAEFLPAGLALQETPGSPSLRWTARILMALVVCTLLWSVFGKVDIVVNASGKIILTARTKTIAAIDVASVRALHVTEGQRVRAGEVLIELDSSSSDAEHDKAMESVTQARLQVARATSMNAAVDRLQLPALPPVAGASKEQWNAARQHLEGLYRDFHARLKRPDGEVTRYTRALPLVAQQADDFAALVQDRSVSQHAWLDKEQARINLEGLLLDVKNQRAALLAQTRKEAHDAITEGNRIIAASAQDQRRAGERSRLLKLVAPVDGTVQQLTVHTVGGVVPAAQPLMQIVPQENIVEVEAFLKNKDVGFISIAQEARVKIDAFDYTRYGTVNGSVKHVSQDAMEDEQQGLMYSANIMLDNSDIVIDGKTVPLTAGMAVNVEIKTGTRRIIAYVLSPLMRHQREALHER